MPDDPHTRTPLAMITGGPRREAPRQNEVLLLVQLDARCFLPIPLDLVPPALLAHLTTARLVRETSFEGNDFVATNGTARLRLAAADAVAFSEFRGATAAE